MNIYINIIGIRLYYLLPYIFLKEHKKFFEIQFIRHKQIDTIKIIQCGIIYIQIVYNVIVTDKIKNCI